MKTKSLTAVLVAASMLAPARSQQTRPAEEQTTIKVDVDIVNVLCSVRDKRGALVPTLTKDDFTLVEEGKPQEIKYFTRETDLPLTIGLLVDVSKSQENLIEVEKRAAERFFSQVLGKKDVAFLISFGAEAELLQDLTGSPALLRRALDGLRLSVEVGGLHPGPVPTSRKPKGTILYDTVYLAATEKLRGEVGRKVIVVITDGVDYGSRYDLRQAMEVAQKSDAIIYSIYYSDPMYAGWGSDSDLKKMAEETGGRVFHISKRHPLEEAFKQIQEEMRSQYAIGYTPVNSEKDGRFRRIEIKTRQKDLKVQARKGYFATKS